jgi:hypothetical protein
MSYVLTLDDLKAATGYKQAGDVEKCLRKNGVRFLYGKTGIYTTLDALNAAMGLQSGKIDYTEAEAEIEIL